MAESPSFISKLLHFRFWKHKKKHPFKRESKPREEGAPRSERRPDKPIKLAESQRPPSHIMEEDPYAVKIPIDHVVYQLWRLCRDQAGWMPTPELRLFDPDTDAQPFTPQEAAGERSRLLSTVTASGTARLNSCIPRPAPNGEEPVPVNLDAQTTIFLSSNLLSAWIFVYPPVGEGRDITQGDLLSALSSAGVSFGLNSSLLETIPGRDDRYFHLFHAAQGQPAIPGEDGIITDLFPREAQRKLPVDEFNRVDFTAATSTQNVEKDQIICHITPPTPGTPGRTVTDKDIPTRDGVPASPPMGRNTLLNEDGTALIAGRPGGLEFSGRAFQINPMLDIPGNVDYSSGNVNFLGDVHIRGDVCSGFTVRAMGNIKVDGVVESCTIEAGGDLVLTKGVQGNNQAVIRAHRDIYAKFLENCTVHAKENLHSECIIGCEVYSDGAVYVQSGRGTIMGGHIWAAREVNVNILGSKTEVRTSINLGGLPCEDFEKTQITQEIAEQEERLKDLEHQPDSPTKLSRMSKLRMQLSVNKLKLGQYTKNLEEFEASASTRPSGRLTFSTAYPGSRVKINENRLKISQETRHSMALLIDGEVRLVS